MLKARPHELCGERRCPPRKERCPKCLANDYLTDEDWFLVLFYRRVETQVINQTPMGTESGRVLVTPRLEGYEAVLRIYGYPERLWKWLTEGACLLSGMVHDGPGVDMVELMKRSPEEFL